MAFEKLNKDLFARPYLAIAILVSIILVALPILSQLRPDNTMDVFYPKDHPTVTFERELRAEFPEDDSLIALFSGEGLYSAETLTALSAIGSTLEDMSAVNDVLSVTTRDHIEGSFDGFNVTPLIDVDALDETTPQERKDHVLADRFAPGLLVAHDGETMALVARMVPGYEAAAALEVEKLMRAEVERLGISHMLIGTTGSVGIETAFFNSMMRDNMLFVPVGIAFGILLLWLMFRRSLALGLAVVTMIATSLSAMSVVVLIGQKLTMPTSMVSPMMIALTIALVVHLYNAVMVASEEGYEGAERFRFAVDEIRRPALFTALTTAAGFGSLMFSPVPPLRSFGISSAVGVLILCAIVLYLLPPILARWDKVEWKAPNIGMGLIDRLVSKIAALTLRRPKAIVAAAGLVLLAGLPATFNIEVETDNFEMLSPSHPLRQTNAHFEKDFSGVTAMEVVFDADERDALKDVDRLAAIKDFETWALAQPEVDYATSMADIVEEMNWAFNAEDPAARALPERARLVSQYLFIYDGDDLYDVANDEFTRTRLSLMMNVHGAREINASIDKLSAELDSRDLDMDWRIAGFGRLFADFEWLVIDSQLKSAIIALTVIFLLMAANWRSLGDAALCMLPNAAPLLFMFILMGATGITLNIGTAIITSVAVGVAVDDTIHMFSGFKRRVANGETLEQAIHQTFRLSGRAVMATTLILSGIFFMLAGSDFLPTMQFGLVTGLGIVAALLFDLFLLPALFILLNRKKLAQQKLVPAVA